MASVFLILFLILVNGIFVMIEIALVSLKKSKLKSKAEKNKSAELALYLADNPSIFLPTVQIVITLISILTGFIAAEKLANSFTPFLQYFIPSYNTAQSISTFIIVFITTLVSIVFGELAPKRFALIYAESISLHTAQFMLTLAKIMAPLVWLLSSTTNFLFRIFRIKNREHDAYTTEELKALISESAEKGDIEETEQEVIERVFDLGDRKITSIMTHSKDIFWIDINDNLEQIKQKVHQHPHTRYPVCDKNLNNVKGVISLKSIYTLSPTDELHNLIDAPILVLETHTTYDVLEQFKNSHQQVCFVIDEYGSSIGMITITDMMEAIVGDLPQAKSEEKEIIEREDGSFFVDGEISFYDFLSYFEKDLPDEEPECDTLAGFMLSELDHIPKVSESIESIHLTFVSVRLWDKRRMILPSSYFIEQPFQNWTRESTEIRGAVFLFTDFMFPIDELRKAVFTILDASRHYWDGITNEVHVLSIKPNGIEIRIIMGARNADDMFELRYIMREKLIRYIQENYPQYFPKSSVIAGDANTNFIA